MTPTFDPETQTWFLPDGREAKTLRELSRGRPLEGYYPNGAPLELVKSKMAEQATILGTDAPRAKAPLPVMSVKEDGGVVSEWKGSLPPVRTGQPASPFATGNLKRNGRPRRYNWEAVMADRRHGMTYAEIAEKHGMRNKSSVATIIHESNRRARLAGKAMTP